MSTAPLSFTGLSSFSNDFQTILTREVAIAKLPLQALQNQQTDILNKKQTLAGLSAAVADVGSSIGALGALGASQALAARSSNPATVSVINTGATSAASYTISNIQSVAAAASETSSTGYATSDTTPVSANGNLSLVLGTTKYPITLDPQHNNLVGLRDAINKSGAGVTASILTTGTGANPNYLAVTANATGQTTLQLNDTPALGPATNLLTNTNQGANAVFNLNGVPVSHSTNTINDVVSGLTFTILGTTAPNASVTLSLGTDRSQLSSALQDFASKYNTLTDEVNAQVGAASGPLNGDFLITQIESDLRQTTSFSGSKSIQGLANLGISLDSSGKMTFDQTAFNSLTDAQIGDAFTFLGSATTGFGALAQKFTQLSDPVSGLIQTQSAGYDRTTQRLTDQIAALNDQIAGIQSSVTTKLQLADANVAALQSQQSILTASVQAIDLSLFGKNFGNAGSGN